ncbi:MAG: threonine--tRNA ligase [Candidatus Dojkabacteria bacterium]|nr:threonine--tRNA ligase [Candidatus Dojkabacteria bacterium]
MSQEENKNRTSELEKMRHSLSHVLAHAVMRLHPDAKLGIGPAIEDGFYYDIDFPKKLTEEDLPKIEKEMRKIISEEYPIQQVILPRDEAMDMLHQQGQIYKTELLNEIPDEEISFYRTGDDFIDMCRGPHMEHTGRLGAFKLMNIAGAYWRGDEKRPQMQRIYGVGFKTEAELNKYLENQAELKKRDHRKLGRELELFMTDDKAGQGLILWLPKGAIIRKIIEDFEYGERVKLGYKPVYTPHIANLELFKQSGHWQHYRDSMYSPLEIDKEKYLLKPMNCPFHAKIYSRKIRSYRDLPIKYAESGTVYRYEKSGELSGLERVRGFTQDDAHVYMREDQIHTLVKETLEATIKLITALGFVNYQVRLSLWDTQDPKKRDKYIDKPNLWNKAERQLREVLEDMKIDHIEGIGEAAYYGPKIDFLVKDALGREEQCGTVQLDFNLPERFDLKYVDKGGKEKRPVMIHWAPLGSMERFFSRLIEHYGGAFPVWLSPVQVRIIPISEKFINYANLVREELMKNNLRVEVDEKDETLQAKIRDAEMEKVPYMLVVGKKEKETQAVAVRPRSGQDLGMMKLEEFLERVKDDIESKK